MLRGNRRPGSGTDLEALEQELAALNERQAALRQELRARKGSGAGLRKLQDKLEKQLATAKWTVQQIHAMEPDWDDVGFYQTVRPVKPTPRGRRPRAAESSPE